MHELLIKYFFDENPVILNPSCRNSLHGAFSSAYHMIMNGAFVAPLLYSKPHCGS